MESPSARLTPLTQLAKTAGCAAKIAQVDLHAALAHLPAADDPRVLVGLDTGDDAAVIRLTDELALIETVDIFTPIVDDPFDYGRIAAANALSDVYAMGGRPLSALSFVAWPVATLGTDSLGRVFQGAAAVCAEAGIAHRRRALDRRRGAQVRAVRDRPHPPGTHRHQRRRAAGRHARAHQATRHRRADHRASSASTYAADRLRPAIESMTALNRAAADAMIEVGVNAATDVTGFGLLGHLGNVLRASGRRLGHALGARLEVAAVPWFDGAVELAARALSRRLRSQPRLRGAPHRASPT